MRYSLVDGQHYFVTGYFCSPQQIAILFAFETRPLGRVRMVTGKAVPDVIHTEHPYVCS